MLTLKRKRSRYIICVKKLCDWFIYKRKDKKFKEKKWITDLKVKIISRYRFDQRVGQIILLSVLRIIEKQSGESNKYKDHS